MPAKVTLSLKGLDELIAETEARGGDATELRKLSAEANEDENARRPVRRRERTLRVMVEEPTTEERLEAEVGGLFPGGIITGEILEKCMEMDGKYTLKEPKDMCREAGLGLSGAKKELASKLIAHE